MCLKSKYRFQIARTSNLLRPKQDPELAAKKGRDEPAEPSLAPRIRPVNQQKARSAVC